jgi:Rrf2 family transcriptional regulator, iron-sulfur cluster assembly transcription factor
MFSKATEYALRAAIFIAQKGSKEKKLGIPEIAAGIHSPPSFTAKILQQLTADDKIISSVRGPNGGFYMTDKAKNLPVRAILEAMCEDDVLEKCVLGLKRCSEVDSCPMHAQYKSIKLQLKRLFEAKTIQHLAEELENKAVLQNNFPIRQKK